MNSRREKFWRLVFTLRSDRIVANMSIHVESDENGVKHMTINGKRLIIKRHRVSFRPISLAVIATSIKLEAAKLRHAEQQEIDEVNSMKTRYGWAHR